VTIGDHVQIGPNVQLLTPTHPVEPGPRRDKWESAKPIAIGDNVWNGATFEFVKGAGTSAVGLGASDVTMATSDAPKPVSR
jgi:maltose O-acetyltransferase